MTNTPEGWNLVPTTATPEMVRAWRSKAVNASFSDAAYQAMIAAAPQPPVQPVKRLERELIDEIDLATYDMEVESSGAMEFARATAWGVTLEGEPLPSAGGTA